MTKYIKIDDLPKRQGRDRGIWADQIKEWLKIPPGSALELDIKGRNAVHTATHLSHLLRGRRIDHLRASRDGERIFIVNEAQQ